VEFSLKSKISIFSFQLKTDIQRFNRTKNTCEAAFKIMKSQHDWERFFYIYFPPKYAKRYICKEICFPNSSIYSIAVLLPIPVPVQVAERLSVRIFDLRRVVHGRPDELKHRLPHVYGEKKHRLYGNTHTSTRTRTHSLPSVV